MPRRLHLHHYYNPATILMIPPNLEAGRIILKPLSMNSSRYYVPQDGDDIELSCGIMRELPHIPVHFGRNSFLFCADNLYQLAELEDGNDNWIVVAFSFA